MITKKRLLIVIFLFIITLPTFAFLLNNQYFPMHDDQHIARLYELHQGIQEGEIYPRWVNDFGFGFGYPLFNFYPPLIYYVAELFILMGFSYVMALKAMLIIGLLLGTLGMFLLARRRTQNVVGLVCAALFTFFSYRAAVIYVRGAFAEFFATSLLPFVFLTLINIFEKPTIRNSVIFGGFLALLILSHPLIAFPTFLYLAIFFITFLYFSGNKLLFFVRSLLGAIFGLALSAFFWLPSMLERKFTLTDNILLKELANYSIHFVYPQQLWHSPWGFGGSGEGFADGMSFQLGKTYIGLAAISFLLLVIYWLKNNVKKTDKKLSPVKLYVIYTVLLIFSIFMMTPASYLIWERISFLHYLQFPWRFLSFVNVFMALVIGYISYFLIKIAPPSSRKANIVVAMIIIVVVIGIQHKYFRPQSLIAVDEKQRTSRQEIAWEVSGTSFEFSPKGIKTKKSKYNTTIPDLKESDLPVSDFTIVDGQMTMAKKKNTAHLREYQVNADKKTTLRLNTFNFPGWAAYVDGVKTKIDDNNDFKLMTITIPKGEHEVSFRFEDTPIRAFAEIVSLMAFVIAVGSVIAETYSVRAKK